MFCHFFSCQWILFCLMGTRSRGGWLVLFNLWVLTAYFRFFSAISWLATASQAHVTSSTKQGCAGLAPVWCRGEHLLWTVRLFKTVFTYLTWEVAGPCAGKGSKSVVRRACTYVMRADYFCFPLFCCLEAGGQIIEDRVYVYQSFSVFFHHTLPPPSGDPIF